MKPILLKIMAKRFKFYTLKHDLLKKIAFMFCFRFEYNMNYHAQCILIFLEMYMPLSVTYLLFEPTLYIFQYFVSTFKNKAR